MIRLSARPVRLQIYHLLGRLPPFPPCQLRFRCGSVQRPLPQAEGIDNTDYYTELSLEDSQPDNGDWGSAACSSLLSNLFSRCYVGHGLSLLPYTIQV